MTSYQGIFFELSCGNLRFFFFFLINTKFQRVYIKKRSYEPVNHNFSQIIWQNMLLSFVAQLGASNIFNGDL